MKQQLSEEEIEAALNSLDGAERAEASPFFYTRLKARMDKKNGASGIAGIRWLKPSLAFAVLALLVAMNVLTIISKKQSASDGAAKTNASVSEQLAKDYDLNIAAY
ncbi:MAG: hypothetical protein ABIX01_20275 [Chitinophagaceae bacterium]